MALFQPLHGNLSGSIAGNTYSHNKGGPYVRRRAVPVNPSSTRQTAIRAALSAGSRAWRNLTDAQRAGWSSYANAHPIINRLGQAVKVTGIAAYNALYTAALDAGNAPATTAPTTAGPTSLVTVALSNGNATSVGISFTATPLGVGARLAVWWTGPGSPSQNPNANQARLIGYSAAAAGSPQVINLPATCPTGTVSNFYIAIVDAQGRRSPFFKARYTFA